MKTRRNLLPAIVMFLASTMSLLAGSVTGSRRTGLPGRKSNVRQFTFEF